MARESFFNISDIIRDRRKLMVFLVCVAVSLLSWLMINLGQEYSSTVLVPVSYVNFPQNKVLLNNIPNQLAVNVNGSGYDLLQYDDKLMLDTLVINLDNLKMSSFGDYERGYLDPAILSQSLQKRINGAIGINRVLSDSIEFLFDLKVSRVVKVKPVVQYSLEAGHVLLDSIAAFPSEVEIFGPLTLLDTLQYIKTKVINTGELNAKKAFVGMLDIDRFGKDARVYPDSVKVQIDVDRLTEKRFMITPEQLNVPDSLRLLTFPTNVEVISQIPISKFNDISKSEFSVSVDYLDLQKDYLVLPVTIEKWPTAARQTKVVPTQVEIVISEKDS